MTDVILWVLAVVHGEEDHSVLSCVYEGWLAEWTVEKLWCSSVAVELWCSSGVSVDKLWCSSGECLQWSYRQGETWSCCCKYGRHWRTYLL